jgi:NAD(P)-dependent dehydrogenase (short-subunit alcohol dehydrogenase family)
MRRRKKVKEFSGKVAVVAGGARGIGKAAARKLATQGAAVLICSDQENQLREALVELRERGPRG